MKANELRIGNYVNNMGVMIKFDEADWECIVSKAFSQNPMERYTPIPLTEDILLKCGFSIHKNADSGDFKGYSFGVNPFSEDYILLIQKATIGYYYDNAFFKINYLHQLQNLYFALTGQELTIKL